ncbi:MAG TPA: O-antigen ligase family protein [Blastocatellia bacterium]|nr:O-antigen ligase family protein [Blastocatellia bacterium]
MTAQAPATTIRFGFSATTMRVGMVFVSVALGAAFGAALLLPLAQALLLCVVLVGVLGLSVWLSVRLPVVPILRNALVAGFFFKSEFDLVKLDRMHSPSGFNVSLILLAAVLLAVSTLFTTRRTATARALPLSFWLTLGALFLWCVLSVAYGSSGLSGLASLWSLSGSLLVCFVVATQFNDREALRQVVLCVAITIGINGLIAVGQNWWEPLNHLTALGGALEEDQLKVGDGEIARVSGLMRNPTALARTLVTWSPVFLALLPWSFPAFRRWQHKLLLASALLMLPALILTYARGGWAAFGVSVVLLLVFTWRAWEPHEQRRWLPRLGAAAVVLVLLCLPFVQAIYVRLTEDDRGSAYARVSTVEVATAMIKDQPLLGLGLNSYYDAARRYDRTPDLISEELFAVHNFYFHIAAEIGVPGVVLFVVLHLLAAWQGWRAMHGSDPLLRALALGLLCGQMAFLLTGLKEPGTLGSWLLQDTFLLWGLLLAVAQANGRTLPAKPLR